ncbi:cbb3-type cytochrome c oxidase N-terminal domain-containing protein [Olleya sp. YS]|uniref:cbb3-type cytochrome c oxidase N-terminal domain-containing protein n=1 Tax=Olleya sp. YS TaxID=3028318 RepID=UPI0024342860|nr:cbb3-type cytochrome c oxidase N-terminal domain-containing protein [Olleya sp. YS]WGD34258.1 cbb3-type cytochrome c oxidase N-terminal domain-containing protein [Olleya sp. YS]
MRHLIPSYVRVPAIFFIIFGLVEFFVDSGDKPAFIEYPIIMLFLALVLFILIAIEGIVGSIENVLFQSLDKEAKERYLASQKSKAPEFTKLKSLYAKLKGDDKPIEEEHEIILDHNYDGIKELDNNLPPWWVYSFYISIVFAFVYLAKYHIFDGATQQDEIEQEYAQAEIEIEEYKKTAKNLVDYNTVTLLTDAADLKAGEAIYNKHCVACHVADGGGGIGPNLTDKYWILGGDIKSVFKTISQGGRSGKGMVSWKKEGLKPVEIAQAASYVLSLQGTTPAKPKDPEGEIWQPESEEDLEIPEEAKDTDVLEVEKSVSMND